jgi:putative transposase
VTVRYDPRDLAEIRVYHRGAFLCRAVSPNLAAVSVSMKDLQAARNQRRRELRQQLTARRSLVDLLTHPDQAPAGSTRAATVDTIDTPTDPGSSRGRRLKIYYED